jgi:hypothetical protein
MRPLFGNDLIVGTAIETHDETRLARFVGFFCGTPAKRPSSSRMAVAAMAVDCA